MSEVQSQGSVFVRRWWPVLVALPLAVLMPVLGVVFAAVMAFTQRRDRPLMYWLLGIVLFWVLWLTLFRGVGGDGVGIVSPGADRRAAAVCPMPPKPVTHVLSRLAHRAGARHPPQAGVSVVRRSRSTPR